MAEPAYSQSYFDRYRTPGVLLRGLRRYVSPQIDIVRPILAGLRPQPNVVDIGCGPGGFLELVRAHRPDSTAIGLDLTVAPRFRLDCARIQGDVCALPLRPGSMDLVICTHVLEHLPIDALAGAVADLAALLAPGGYLYLETPGPRATWALIGGFADDPTHVRPYTSGELREISERAGLRCARAGRRRALLAAALAGLALPVTRNAKLGFTYLLGMNEFVLARAD